MRKILSLLIGLILLFLFFTASAKSALACSSFTLSQTVLPFNYNNTLTLTSATNCFGDVEYMVLAYPSRFEGNPSYYSDISTTTGSLHQRRTNEREIKVPIDLSFGDRGKNYPGSWTLKVCTGGGTLYCDQNKLAQVSFTVNPAPTPTPTQVPSNLVRVAPLKNQCKYQTGSALTILLVENIEKNTTYRWWWDKDLLKREAGRTDANGSPISFTISSSETSSVGRKVLCVDIEDLSRDCVPGERNTITIQFEATPPTEGLSCVPLAGGGLGPATPVGVTIPPGTPFQPQLCTPIGGEKDKGVQTAVGCIPTDPGGLVSFLLRFILGLSGGIALLLIIFSGYRMATSAGNPEALQGARETLTSAIVGLIFIVLSIVILRIIGVEILVIPGFEK